MITAELFARAIIASAVSIGEFSATRQRTRDLTPQSYLPAAVAVAQEAGLAVSDTCRILGVSAETVAIARGNGGGCFITAQWAAREAIRYHLKAKAAEATRQAPKPALVQPEPSPAPPVARTAPVQTRRRAIPKSARFENIGGRVQVIRLKPITDSIARHAHQQIERGADLDDVAELFEVCAESLRTRIEGLTA